MPVLLKLVFVLLGLGAAGASVRMRNAVRRAASWPGVEGQIVESLLQPDPHDAGSSIRLAYTFSVGERMFKSTRISFGARRDSLSAKEQLLARYPVGRKFTVYYNPDDPQQSVLERSHASGWPAVAAVGAVLVAIGWLSP